MIMRKRSVALLVLAACNGGKDPAGEGGTGAETGEWTFAVEGDGAVTAGEAAEWTVTLTDGSGADRTADAAFELDVALSDGSADSEAGLSWTPTLAGDHSVTVTATVDGETFSETLDLAVSPAEAALVTLSLDALSADIGGSIHASAEVTDAYGNATDGDVTYSASPEGASVNGATVTFAAEGAYTVTASLAGGGSDSEGPVYVDENAPFIALSSPARGAWIEGTTIVVAGTVQDAVTGVASLTLEGEPLAIDGSGSFSAEITAPAGAATLTLEAVDNDGNASDLVVGAMAGTYLPFGQDLAQSVLVRLNQGALDAMSEGMADTFDPAAIEAGLKAANPIVDETISCISAAIEAEGFTLSGVEAALDPTTGALNLQIDAEDLELTLGGEADLCGFDGPISGTITADTVTITTALSLAVAAPGDVQVATNGTAASFTGFDYDFGSLETLLDVFGYTLADLGLDVEALVAEALVAAVDEEVPGALADALAEVAIEESFDLLAASASLEAQISAADVDETGLTLTLDSQIGSSASYADIPANPGSVLQGGAGPAWPETPGLLLSLSADTFNRLLHAAWDGGGFHQSYSDEELGLDPSLIEAFFPGAETLSLVLTPLLPPVLTPGETEEEPFLLTMAELQIEAWGEVDGVETLLTEAAVFVEAGVAPTLEGGEILLVLGDTATTVDVLTAGPETVTADEQQEVLLGVAAGTLLGDVFPEVGFSAPELGELSLTLDAAYGDGEIGTWLTVEGDIAL